MTWLQLNMIILMFKILEVLLISSRHSMILVLEEGLSSLLTYFVSSKLKAVLFISPQPHYSYQLAIQLALPLAYVQMFKSLFAFLSPVLNFLSGNCFSNLLHSKCCSKLSYLLNSMVSSYIQLQLQLYVPQLCVHIHIMDSYSQLT